MKNSVFNLSKIHDLSRNVKGAVSLILLDSDGKTISKKIISVTISAFDRSSVHSERILPEKTGGYLLLVEFLADGSKNPVIFRRFINVGEVPEFKYSEMQPTILK